MGLDVKGAVDQKQNPDKAYCAGLGKLEEIKRLVQVKNAEFVIFNNMLTGSQLNNIEEYVGAKVIDRPMLILEIFARHATSNEGKLQVQLDERKRRNQARNRQTAHPSQHLRTVGTHRNSEKRKGFAP